MSIPRRSSAGFTLVELLVAAALMAIVIVGVLNMLDTSTNISKVEAAVADTQENVRFAAYHIMRTARMAGGAEMPFARADGTWVVGEVLDDQTGSPTITGFGTVQVAPASDILVLRGFFETPVFFTNHSDLDAASGTVVIREHRIPGDAGSNIINPLDGVPLTTDALVGRGIVFMGMRRYQVGSVTSWAVSGTVSGADRQITIGYDAGTGVWPSLNVSGAGLASGADPTFPVFRVGLLQSYAYYVTPDFTLMRLRAPAGSNPEPVAVNIGSLQVSVGIDTNNDGVPDTFDPNPSAATVAAAQVTALRITVLGRTPFEVRDWTEPAETFTIQGDDPDITLFNRSAKWRRMDVTAGLRNFSL